jgi:hypothetical protein
MSRQSNNPNYAYEAEERPILDAWPEFWSMSEKDHADLLEYLARLHGGIRPRHLEGRER